MSAILNPTKLPASVHVVDDDPSVLRALLRMLSVAGYDAHGHASAQGALDARQSAPRPEHAMCFVLDMVMPDVSGLDLQAQLDVRDDPPQVVFVTGYQDVSSTVLAMRAGAVDVLTKPVPQDRLVCAVGRALIRDHEACQQREKQRAWKACHDSLTARERDVYERVVLGDLNKQIAAELGMAERTVKWHRAQIMEKMHAPSLAELVRMSRYLPPYSDN